MPEHRLQNLTRHLSLNSLDLVKRNLLKKQD